MKHNPEFIDSDINTSEDDSWEVVYGIDTPEGADLKVGKDGNVIEVDFKVISYPKAGTRDYDRTKKLLLEAKSRHPSNLRLPANSTSLANILNEAAGSTDSFEMSPNTSRTIRLVTEIFRVLAKELITVADASHKMPTAIGYKQVLVDKDSFEAKLLPPVEFQDVSRADAHKRLRELGRQMIQSMAEGSATPSQRALTDMLAPTLKEIFH
jgi:hypothetical protein